MTLDEFGLRCEEHCIGARSVGSIFIARTTFVADRTAGLLETEVQAAGPHGEPPGETNVINDRDSHAFFLKNLIAVSEDSNEDHAEQIKPAYGEPNPERLVHVFDIVCLVNGCSFVAWIKTRVEIHFAVPYLRVRILESINCAGSNHTSEAKIVDGEPTIIAQKLHLRPFPVLPREPTCDASLWLRLLGGLGHFRYFNYNYQPT